jgi:hypothetical protein
MIAMAGRIMTGMIVTIDMIAMIGTTAIGINEYKFDSTKRRRW